MPLSIDNNFVKDKNRRKKIRPQPLTTPSPEIIIKPFIKLFGETFGVSTPNSKKKAREDQALKVLIINPGATSTKIAVFDEDNQIFKKGIDHSAQELDRFDRVIDRPTSGKRPFWTLWPRVASASRILTPSAAGAGCTGPFPPAPTPSATR